MSHPQFDPSVIERYAEQLYRKADSVRIGAAIAGAMLGVVFGAAPMSPLGQYLPIPSTFGMATVLLGALVGGFIGYVVGEGRAFQTRLQAQMVLFQVQLERNTAAAGTPAAVAPPVAAPVVAPPPVPVPTPVAAPAPVAPPVAAPAPVQAPAAPEPLIPIQAATPAAPPAQPLFPIAPPVAQPAPPPVLAPAPAAARPALEAVPPLESPAQPEPTRLVEDLAPPLLPPLSPTANSGS